MYDKPWLTARGKFILSSDIIEMSKSKFTDMESFNTEIAGNLPEVTTVHPVYIKYRLYDEIVIDIISPDEDHNRVEAGFGTDMYCNRDTISNFIVKEILNYKRVANVGKHCS